MKTKEFIKRVEEFGLKVRGRTSASGRKYLLFYIPSNCNPVVEVCVNHEYSFNTNWCGFNEMSDEEREKLFKLIVKYASTPPEEREEEKKYYIKHKYLANGWNYLNYIEEIEAWRITWKQESDLSLTQFTLAELPGWVHEMLEDGYLVKEEV